MRCTQLLCRDQIRQGEFITLPIAATMNIDVRNTHLNYALTWFDIAYR